MIEDRRHALLDAVDVQSVGRGLCALERQLAVNSPPGTVEHLIEIRGVVALDGKAAGQCGINMRMGVDERRHDDAAACIKKLRLRISGAERSGLADRFDLCPVNADGAVLQIRKGLTAGDQSAVSKNIHARVPPVCDFHGVNKTKMGMQNHSFNISTQESLSDSRKPVRAALRYSYQSEIVILLYTTLPVPARLFRRQIRPNFCREFWQYCTNTSVNKRYMHVSVCNTFPQECKVLKDIKKSLLLSAVFCSETA